MSETLSGAGRTVTRSVAVAMIQYHAVRLDSSGQETQVLMTADRFEEVSLPLIEAARLDALGALAPEGHTREQIMADMKVVHDAYIAQRQQMPVDGAAF